jgi:multicomponent Na+:H+ antiporter subunit E
MIPYAFWLFKEIVKSSLHVSRAVINPDMVDASVLWFKADYDNPLARAVLANSITLTPGTITIDIFEDGIYSVNAVTKASRDELLDGTMQHKVAWVFGEEIDYKVLGVEDKDENERGE